MEGSKGGPERIQFDAEPSEMKTYHLWPEDLPLGDASRGLCAGWNTKNFTILATSKYIARLAVT